MEEFLNIDWLPPLDDVVDDVFVNEERLVRESVMYKILQGGFTDPFTEFETDDSEAAEDEEEEEEEEEEKKDRKNEIGNKEDKRKEVVECTKQTVNGYVPGIVKSSFQFPRMSNLNKEQHATCLRVLLRFSGSEKPEINTTNRNELELYMQLVPTIREEQDEFLQLAKANWKGTQLKIIGEAYVDERWKRKVENVKKLPRHYVAAGNIPFNGKDKISVTAEATLLELGQIPRVAIPTSLNKRRFTIQPNLEKLRLLYPPSSDSDRYKTTVSEDPNCERLTESGDIDLVISSAGLNCLANNFGPNYTRSWILPIVVKENKNGNVVYIDKPLPPTALTAVQKNSWIYKYFLRAALLNPYPFFIRLTKKEKEARDDSCLFGNPNSDDLLKLEEEHGEFQSATTKVTTDSLKPASTSLQNFSKTNDSTVNGESNMLETEENSEELFLSESLPKMDSSFECETLCSEETETAEEIVNDGTSETETCVSSINSSSEKKVVYRSFTLGPSADANDDSTKTKPENYKILVRARIDGIEKLDKQTMNPVMLAPKLEHQVALGAEAVTPEEALKQWTTLTFRPNTSLVRIRISADNSEVIQIERRTPISINNEIKRLYNINVEDSLITLHNVVRDLKILKPGKYLLRHTPTNGAFATVYQKTDIPGKNVFDLHCAYAQDSFQTIPISPWPALDKAVITPAQICFERLPAMYRPQKTDVGIKSKVGRGRGRGGRARGCSRGGGAGAAQNTGRGAAKGSTRGGTRVRTKKAKKKKNKGQPKAEEQ